jgi:hypothetical protein
MMTGIRSCNGAIASFAARVMMVNGSIVSLGGALRPHFHDRQGAVPQNVARSGHRTLALELVDDFVPPLRPALGLVSASGENRPVGSE